MPPAALSPHVVTTPPPGWATAEVVPPKIAESAGAELVDWRAAASPSNDAAIVSACVATPIPGWVEEMRTAVEARTTALAGAAAERITGAPVDARADGEGAFALRAASALDAAPIGLARIFVGFDEERLFTCFASCAARGHGAAGAAGSSAAALACEAVVRSARLEDSRPPPAPGLSLRGVTWAVHHPRPAALGAAGLVVAIALAAVALRRRPRSLRRGWRRGITRP
jgi:hypothetical protein